LQQASDDSIFMPAGDSLLRVEICLLDWREMNDTGGIAGWKEGW